MLHSQSVTAEAAARGSCDTEEEEGRERQSKGAADAAAKFSRKIILAGGAAAARKEAKGRKVPFHTDCARAAAKEEGIALDRRGGKNTRKNQRAGGRAGTQDPLLFLFLPLECIFTTLLSPISDLTRVVHDRPRPSIVVVGQRESRKGHRDGRNFYVASVGRFSLTWSVTQCEALASCTAPGKIDRRFRSFRRSRRRAVGRGWTEKGFAPSPGQVEDDSTYCARKTRKNAPSIFKKRHAGKKGGTRYPSTKNLAQGSILCEEKNNNRAIIVWRETKITANEDTGYFRSIYIVCTPDCKTRDHADREPTVSQSRVQDDGNWEGRVLAKLPLVFCRQSEGRGGVAGRRERDRAIDRERGGGISHARTPSPGALCHVGPRSQVVRMNQSRLLPPSVLQCE